jgi:signal peptidase I
MERGDANGINELRSDLLGLFEAVLKTGADMRVRVTGMSMAPFLKGGEVITIKKVHPSDLRKGDIILFKNQHGLPVVHRIVRKINSNSEMMLQTKGDSVIVPDEPIHYADVLGKATKIEKDSSAGIIEVLDMESIRWRLLNFFQAVFQVQKAKRYFAPLRYLGRKAITLTSYLTSLK